MNGTLRHIDEFRIDNQQFRLGVIENEADCLRIQPCVDGVQHSTGHGHTEMRLKHFRDIRRDDGDRIALANATGAKPACEPAHAVIGLQPVALDLAIDHRCLARINLRAPLEKAERCHLRKVGLCLLQVAIVNPLASRSLCVDGHICLPDTPR